MKKNNIISAPQTFRLLSLIYRKITRMGFSYHKGLGLADSLMAVSELRLPGTAGDVLRGLEAQGNMGECRLLCSHLLRAGIEPGTLMGAALVWHAVRNEADRFADLDPRYRTISRTYGLGLEIILDQIGGAFPLDPMDPGQHPA